MARRRRTPVEIPLVDFSILLEADFLLFQENERCSRNGYERTSARLWQRKDGSFTARVVWRNRAARISTVTYIVQGLHF